MRHSAHVVLVLVGMGVSLWAQDVPWWQAAPGPAYQVLIYSFADSDGDGYGDLRGLMQKLDYLNDGNPRAGDDLGISALWLSPIHPASSYHGYDVKDYYAIDSRLGTMADFERLVSEAHKRGIRIILDMVFNHTSREHPWFLDAMKSATSPYVPYYKTRDPRFRYGSGGMGRFYTYTRPDGSQFEYFAAFWEGMPDLNLDNTDVVNELKKVLQFWLQKGVDGFRFDAAKHAFDPNEFPSGTQTLTLNKTFWNDLRRFARRIKPDVYFIGEILSTSLTEVSSYASVFDGLFDFPTANLILNSVRGVGISTFIHTCTTTYRQYQRVSGFVPSPLLSNHDLDRPMSSILQSLGLDAVQGYAITQGEPEHIRFAKIVALKQAKLAAALYLTLPGLPYIYYGEELGMTGRRYKNDDVARRDAFLWAPANGMPMVQWTKRSGKIEEGQNTLVPSVAEQWADPQSLLRHYASLSQVRSILPALQDGELVPLSWEGSLQGNMVGWLRQNKTQKVLVVHNLDNQRNTFRVPQGVGLLLYWSTEAGCIAPQKIQRIGTEASLELPALSSIIALVQE
ncbi:MAG: alpha-amylase family glycosyl hydrolase [Treponemataceae bacterium]|nr:alpha-amylase family glycosyl hydrolase [Treponemataceae bacterium]